MTPFRATLGSFAAPEQRAEIDALAAWLEATYRDDLRARPSRHVYVSTLPADVGARIGRLASSERVLAEIRAQYPDAEITPIPETDEVYLSHYNRDRGGDQGLFDRHYDGNLRNLPLGSVVRLLIYVRSTGAYNVVFDTSGVSRRCATYDLALIDFHRELHWVEGAYDPDDGDRIVLKCNFLVTPVGRTWVRGGLWGLNVGQFYVVKAAMEYSKSPRTVPQRVVGRVCNAARVLNNVHPLLPHAVGLGVPLALGAALVAALGSATAP